ncbi:MAG TPA: adenylate kinase [Lacipirellulaceae bacterium]|jgi:adenylate kinase
MRIVFVGPPGSGKGTQSQRLKDDIGVVHLSTGEMLREALYAGTSLGIRAAQFADVGKLVPDEVVLGIVVDRLEQSDCIQGCLFDGFPRTLAQAEALDGILAERGMPLDLVLALQVPDEQIFKRLAARGRADDKPETIKERLHQYRDLTAPLLEYYLRRGILRQIDGVGTEEEVFARVQQAVLPARH